MEYGEENITWIKLYRELLNKSIWLDSSPEHKIVIITLLLMVNYKEREWLFNGRRFKARAGETVTSLDSIVQNAGRGISVQNVRSAIDKLKTLGFIEEEVGARGRHIRILNWDKYQGSIMEETPPDFFDNKKVTINKQGTNKVATANKKDNKAKKANNPKQQQEGNTRVMDYYRCCGFGGLNNGVREILTSLEKEYGEEQVIAAIKIAVKANCYKISYVEGVLKYKKRGQEGVDGKSRKAVKECRGGNWAGL